ncbi:hypothetical protein [Streptomyces flavidovirens]|uniref:hypothetical protein n=1 Tax=Streptomyces flavidovirens TaxID=67298 RepID=UPI0003FDA928|nr:hypothetical protein [Streptomyces flavidovirens]
MEQCTLPSRGTSRRTRSGAATARVLVLTAALTGTAFAAGVGTAVADTNTGTQKSTMLCNVVLLSPGADVDGCTNVQVSGQEMTKNGTANTALVDYAKVETVTSLLP